MIKIIGCLMVLVCSTGLGITGAGDLRRHCKELRLLKQAMYLLRGEIKYSKAPLPEAFGILAERSGYPFSKFFAGLSRRLAQRKGQTLKEFWQEGIQKELCHTTLRKEEKQKLEQLGEGLGYLDLEMQISTIDLYLEQLEEDIERAREEMQTKQKLYQSLGVAGGIFLVILLV